MRRIPGRSLKARNRPPLYEFVLRSNMLTIPRTHRGPDLADASYPEQARWLDKAKKLVENGWYCQWRVKAGALDALMKKLSSATTVPTVAEHSALVEARSELQFRDRARAMAMVTELLRRHPDWVEALLLRGEGHMKAKDHRAAAIDFDAAATRDPKDPLAHLGAGEARAHDPAQDDEALACFARALDADRHCNDARRGIARIHLRAGRLDESLEMLATFPCYGGPHYQAYTWSKLDGDLEGALRIVETQDLRLPGWSRRREELLGLLGRSE